MTYSGVQSRSEAAVGRRSKRSGHVARGFTLVDLAIAVMVLLVIAAVAMPSMRPDDRARLLGAGSRLVSDLEYARSLSIGDPSNPATLVLREEGDGYWLARVETPETPIERNGLGDPYEVIFGEGTADMLTGITLTLVGSETGGSVVFDAFGRLNPAVAAELRLTNELGDLPVLVDPWTGDTTLDAIVPAESEN